MRYPFLFIKQLTQQTLQSLFSFCLISLVSFVLCWVFLLTHDQTNLVTNSFLLQAHLSPLLWAGRSLRQNNFLTPLHPFLRQKLSFAHSWLVAPSSLSRHRICWEPQDQDAACSRSPRAHLDCHASHGVHLSDHDYRIDCQLHW